MIIIDINAEKERKGKGEERKNKKDQSSWVQFVILTFDFFKQLIIMILLLNL